MLCLSYVSCGESDSLKDPVYIRDVRPLLLSEGGSLSVYGRGFGIEGINDRVYVTGVTLEVLYWSDQRVDCRLPVGLIGAHSLIIQTDNFISQPYEIEINGDTIEEAEETEEIEG